MIIKELVVDGKNLLDSPLDTTAVVNKVFSDVDFSNGKASSGELGFSVEKADRVPPSFVCAGRCDACLYGDFVAYKRVR